ncbi:uncharacterized protein LOC131220268 [Magnolia sinica]|uniref:uncharacterized protein LOC131220268 n=1 Tax=Magnolia sinica TaxID=86752 RepID=UPI002658444B|nr:uncharacterized protein LOC131220268 [Magnolia sinica]
MNSARDSRAGEWQTVKPRQSKGSEWSLFVGNLAFGIKEEDLQKRFGQFGDINDIYFPSFARSGRKRGYAFVRFQNKGNTQTAKEKLHDRFMGRRRMIVNDASQRLSPSNPPTIIPNPKPLPVQKSVNPNPAHSSTNAGRDPKQATFGDPNHILCRRSPPTESPLFLHLHYCP